MKNVFRILLSLLLCASLVLAAAPTTGQFLFQRKSAAGPYDQFGVTPVANRVFGWDGTDVVMVTGGAGSATWGSITGTLSAQTDLQAALNLLQPKAGVLALGGFSSITGSLPTANGGLPTQTGNSGKFLTTNGTTPSWATLTTYVSSVGLTAPSIFSVAGSPVTSSGTLALSLATQSANTVWAGPSTGAAATPTFRALVAADIPSLSSVYQPLDSDLTLISAQTNTTFGLSLLTPANAGAARTLLGAGTSSFDGVFSSLSGKPTTLAGYGITDAQGLNSGLTAISALATDAFGLQLLTKTSAGAVRSYIGAGTSSFDGVFSSLSGKPTTFGGYGISDSSANLRAALIDESGSGAAFFQGGDFGNATGTGLKIQTPSGNAGVTLKSNGLGNNSQWDWWHDVNDSSFVFAYFNGAGYIHPLTISATGNITFSGVIQDTASSQSADFENRILNSPTGPSIGWGDGDRSLYDQSGAVSLYWETRQLSDAANVISANWDGRYFADTSGTASLSWEERKLYSSGGAGVIADWSSPGVLTISGQLVVTGGATITGGLVTDGVVTNVTSIPTPTYSSAGGANQTWITENWSVAAQVNGLSPNNSYGQTHIRGYYVINNTGINKSLQIGPVPAIVGGAMAGRIADMGSFTCNFMFSINGGATDLLVNTISGRMHMPSYTFPSQKWRYKFSVNFAANAGDTIVMSPSGHSFIVDDTITDATTWTSASVGGVSIRSVLGNVPDTGDTSLSVNGGSAITTSYLADTATNSDTPPEAVIFPSSTGLHLWCKTFGSSGVFEISFMNP